MTPAQALQILANGTERVPATRSEHHTIEEALRVIAKALGVEVNEEPKATGPAPAGKKE